MFKPLSVNVTLSITHLNVISRHSMMGVTGTGNYQAVPLTSAFGTET